MMRVGRFIVDSLPFLV